MAVPIIRFTTALSINLLDVSGIFYSFIYTEKAVSRFGSDAFFSRSTLTTSSELLGFWTLSIVQYSENKGTQRFANWICFRP
jgi:hypothetical protein